jgi:hypothetical protein
MGVADEIAAFDPAWSSVPGGIAMKTPGLDHYRTAGEVEVVSLALPPINSFPARNADRGPKILEEPGQAALDKFLADAVRWGTVRVALSGRVTLALWALFMSNVLVGAWLFAVLRGWMECGGRLCSTATLGGHPAITFGLAASSVVVLLAMSFRTRGLTEGGGPELIVLSMASVVAFVSIIGAVLVLVFLAAVVALAITVLVAVMLTVSSS